jgi:hypothetical protein
MQALGGVLSGDLLLRFETVYELKGRHESEFNDFEVPVSD